jgi:hypothetical protein
MELLGDLISDRDARHIDRNREPERVEWLAGNTIDLPPGPPP